MTKISSKIALPIVLSGLFVISIFIALNYETLQLDFYIVLLLLTFFVFFFGYAIGQKIGAPVKQMLERATDISNGDLSVRISVGTKDEMEGLAQIFNKIAEDLQRTRTQEENTQKSVDLKVRAKTQILQETISALEQKVRNRSIETERLMREIEALQQKMKEDKKEEIQEPNKTNQKEDA
jgi:methyl-accepting chemotaxis protein